jgi:DNA-binding GntR family transcriptional regulator
MSAASPLAVKHSPLSQQVAEELRRRIDARRLPPGMRLDESALAGELGISRTPLREALKTLAAEGLVDKRPHRGCFVTEMSMDDVAEIFPVMALLEGAVASAAAKKASEADLRRLERLHGQLERHAGSGDIDRYYATNYEFHSLLQDIAGNRWLQQVIDDLRKLLKLSRHRSLRLEGRLADSLTEHRELMAALQARRGREAERIMRRHLMAQLDALQTLAATGAA